MHCFWICRAGPRAENNRSAQIAQSVEQRTENPRVGGSIPSLGIFSKEPKITSLFLSSHLCVALLQKKGQDSSFEFY